VQTSLARQPYNLGEYVVWDVSVVLALHQDILESLLDLGLESFARARAFREIALDRNAMPTISLPLYMLFPCAISLVPYCWCIRAWDLAWTSLLTYLLPRKRAPCDLLSSRRELFGRARNDDTPPAAAVASGARFCIALIRPAEQL
jgi:hypothetical protein